MLKREDIEIMSPAGSFEALEAALQAGAGSVYFGIDRLNMRSRSAKNFKLDDLKEIAGRCADRGAKSYLTLNSIIYDEDLSLMKELALAAKDSGVSAIIAHDMSTLNFAKENGIELHLSTQSNITNIEAVKFYANYADVIVLARELNLEQVRYICSEIERQDIRGPKGERIRIEIFIHGALCMAVSGKCYLSLHEKGYSANRGDCLQPCRRKYEVKDKSSDLTLEIDNEYIMSPKDLCTISFLDKVLDAGATVLKIEGRGRSPEYVKRVTEVYHQAVNSYVQGDYTKDKIAAWEEKLDEVFNRGFWDGYYLGRTLGEWSDKYGSKATKKKVHLGYAVNYYGKIGVGEFLMQTGELQIGDEIAVIGPTTGVMETSVKEMRTDAGKIEKALQGDIISIPLDFKVRENDVLYKYISRRK